MFTSFFFLETGAYATSFPFLQSIITQPLLIIKNQHRQEMINSVFCPETFPQYAYNPALGLCFLAESGFSEQLARLQGQLEKEMSELRQETANMARLVEELRQQVDEKKKGGKRSKINKVKKVYLKDRHCPHDNCGKRYSSKIALNAHIKKVHQKQPEDSSEYVF